MKRLLRWVCILLIVAEIAAGVSWKSNTSPVQAGFTVQEGEFAPDPLPVFATTHVLYDREGNPLPDDGAGRWIDIDLSTQQLSAYEGGRIVRTLIVSTGTRYHPTITGQFRIYEKFPLTTMSGPGYIVENVPHAMYFYQGYSIHGTYWHSNFGTPASHGCVQLPTQDAAWLYNWASIGTLVYVHN